MKIKNEYVAPQMLVVNLNTGDIATVSCDTEDNWLDDVFGSKN